MPPSRYLAVSPLTRTHTPAPPFDTRLASLARQYGWSVTLPLAHLPGEHGSFSGRFGFGLQDVQDFLSAHLPGASSSLLTYLPCLLPAPLRIHHPLLSPHRPSFHIPQILPVFLLMPMLILFLCSAHSFPSATPTAILIYMCVRCIKDQVRDSASHLPTEVSYSATQSPLLGGECSRGWGNPVDLDEVSFILCFYTVSPPPSTLRYLSRLCTFSYDTNLVHASISVVFLFLSYIFSVDSILMLVYCHILCFSAVCLDFFVCLSIPVFSSLSLC
jgi:hypothetical protein